MQAIRARGSMIRGDYPLPLNSQVVQPLIRLRLSLHAESSSIQLSSTSLAMSRLQEGQVDIYEPGTVRERAYIRGISSIYHTDSIVDSATIADNLI